METLEYGKYYHIYNRGNSREDLFLNHGNFEYYLRLYEKHVEPIADTFAWCLMKNHFHLLVRIKDISNLDRVLGPIKVENPKQPNLYFSNLFNAYSQAFNKQQSRCGALFQRSFKRNEVTSDRYFRNLVQYIHKNPVHHGFIDDVRGYPRSSYGSIISLKPTKLQRNEVIGWFDNLGNFIELHNRKPDYKVIENLIIVD